MGVRGLSSYIKNDPANFRAYKIHNVYVVIDGFNIINFLYINSQLYTQFNGEYLAFDTVIETFVTNLRQCRVEPIFVFDGVHETSKLATSIKRATDRLNTCVQLQKSVLARPNLDGDDPEFRLLVQPPLTSVCFAKALDRLNVLHVTADHEADQMVAALAIHLACPIISNDSDFYVLGPYWRKSELVEEGTGFCYIPLDLCSFQPCLSAQLCSACSESEKDSCCYLEAQRFCPTAKIFRQLPPPLRPVFATLCGNDYIPSGYFNRHLPGASTQLQRVGQARNWNKFGCLIDWLSGFDGDVVNPVERILSKFPLTERKQAARFLFAGLASYAVPRPDSVYLNYLLSRGMKQETHETSPLEQHEPKPHPEQPQSDGTIALQILKHGSRHKEIPMTINWPQALINAFRGRQVMAAPYDAIYSSATVMGPVLEDLLNREPYHLCSIPLRRLIYSLTANLEKKTSDTPRCHTPGLQGPSHRPFVTEYSRVGFSRLEHRRVGIEFLAVPQNNEDFLHHHLCIPPAPPVSIVPAWLHGVGVLFFLWLRSDAKQTHSDASSDVPPFASSPIGLSLALLTVVAQLTVVVWGQGRDRMVRHFGVCTQRVEDGEEGEVKRRKQPKPLRFTILHAMAQTQSIYYHLVDLAGLLDALHSQSDGQEEYNTCLELPPPQIFFASGRLAHSLANRISSLAPRDRLPAILDVWLPCLLGPQNPHLAETTSLFSGLVGYVDKMLDAAPIPDFRVRHQQQQEQQSSNPKNVAVKRQGPCNNHNQPSKRRQQPHRRHPQESSDSLTKPNVDEIVAKAMQEAGLTDEN